MQNQYVGAWIKGFYKVADYALRQEVGMKQQVAEEKLKILKFWDKHGLEATLDAYGVKRRTLYLWKHTLKAGKGSVQSLNNKSRRPKHLRKRKYPEVLVREIRRLRRAHNNLGKEKLHVLLKPFCESNTISLPSFSN